MKGYSLMGSSMKIEARQAFSPRVPNELVYLQDETDNNDEWWVLLRESGDSAMILFTGMRKETAERIKQRIEEAIRKAIGDGLFEV